MKDVYKIKQKVLNCIQNHEKIFLIFKDIMHHFAPFSLRFAKFMYLSANGNLTCDVAFIRICGNVLSGNVFS